MIVGQVKLLGFPLLLLRGHAETLECDRSFPIIGTCDCGSEQSRRSELEGPQAVRLSGSRAQRAPRVPLYLPRALSISFSED